MTKIILAANSMISHPEKISDITLEERGEIYFKYDNKTVWGIENDNQDYILRLYPQTKDIDELISVTSWNNYPMVSYSTMELKTREAYETFKELYSLLNEKLYNVDKLLDDIIDPF